MRKLTNRALIGVIMIVASIFAGCAQTASATQCSGSGEGECAKSPLFTPADSAPYFDQAFDGLPRGIPVNVLLYPMEGDPMASSSFWQLAMATQGSFLSLSEDWP